MQDIDTIEIILEDQAATEDLARAIARLVRPGDAVALNGDLGMGKSVFARAFVRALTGDADEDVPSPTFTLVQTYEADEADVWHMDLYRLQDPEEALELGIEDAFHEAISIVEWPDRLGYYLPRHRLDVTIAAGESPTARTIRLTGHGDWQERLRESGHA